MFPFFGGGWPTGGMPVQLEPPPSKPEHIYLDQNPGWYQDTRKEGYHPPAPVLPNTGAMNYPYMCGQPGMPMGFGYPQYGSGFGQFGWPMAPGQCPQPGQFPNYTSFYGNYFTSDGKYDPYKLYNETDAFKCLSKQYSQLDAGTIPYPWTGLGMASMPGMPGMQFPYSFPAPTNPMAMQAQAQYAAQMNAQLGMMQNAQPYWVGGPGDMAAQQAFVAAQYGFRQPPTQFAPYKPGNSQQFWCKELDGSWTLRAHDDIMAGDVSPGKWERHPTSGYFFWVRDRDS